MSYSEDFREAARSFNGQPFTREELKNRLYEDPKFSYYFHDYQAQSFCGVMIVPVGDGRYVLRENVGTVRRNPTQRARVAALRVVHINYAQMLNSKNNGRFERLLTRTGPHGETLEVKEGTNGYLIKLNKHNSDLVEYWIQNDPGYIPFTEMIFENYVRNNGGHFPMGDRSAVLAVIRIIDIENSTMRWRFDRQAVFNMLNYIMHAENNFWIRLRNGEPDLVQDLADASSTDDGDAKSLASKVCKYCAQFDPDINNTDLFYINDSFVRHVLRFYWAAYFNENKTNEELLGDGSYQVLFHSLRELHEHVEEDVDENDRIDKSRFDHIMWYCYKNSGD